MTKDPATTLTQCVQHIGPHASVRRLNSTVLASVPNLEHTVPIQGLAALITPDDCMHMFGNAS